MDNQINHLQAKLTSAYTSFIQVAHQLNPDKRLLSGVCGKWSPKEVISHLVGWDESLKALIVAPNDFKPPYDVHNFNAQSVTARKHLTWEESLHEMETNSQALKQALVTVESEMKIYTRIINWLPGRIADYELHTKQLKAWLLD